MDFKVIKSLDDKPFRNLYEMSQDGKAVRSIADKDHSLPLLPGATVKVELIDASGKKKTFGLKTLYWASWNKALPENALAGLEAKAIIKPQRGKRIESSLTVKAADLLSKYNLGRLNEVVQRRSAKGLNATGQELAEDKKQTIRIVLHNPQLNMAIVHIESQSWRDGYWFINLGTGKHEAFEDCKHRKDGMLGDGNILWPGL